MDAEELKKRTKESAIKVIRLYQTLPKTEEVKIIGRQLMRASTSVASNYRAACRARSNREFYSKMCIVVEECDETLFWLEMLEELDMKDLSVLNEIKKESEELLRIFSSSKKTVKQKLK